MNGDEFGGERRPSPRKGRYRELFALLAVFLVALATPSVTDFVGARLDGAFGSDPSPMEIVADAGPATARTRSAGVEIVMAGAAASSPGPLLSIRGSIDFAEETGTMTAPLSVVVGEGASGYVDGLRIGTALYVRTPRMTELVPGAKPWLRFDAADFSAGSGTGFLDELTPLDPDGDIAAAVFVVTYFFGSTNELLRPSGAGLYEEARVVGKERVRGVQTTHYEMVVNQGLFREQLSDDLRSDAGDVTADVWVDEDGRLRRSRLNMSVATAPGPATGGSTHEFFDLGAKVRVQEPPAHEVTTTRELLEAHARARRP